MLSTTINPKTGFILGGEFDATYWAPESFKTRYDKTARETRTELNIAQQARIDAINLEPKTDTLEWSQTERQIVTRCQDALNHEIDKLTNEINEYEKVIHTNSSFSNHDQIDNLFDNNQEVLVKEVESQLNPHGSGLGSALLNGLKNRDVFQRQYRAFRREHQRNQNAVYPHSKFWHGFFIFLIFIGEGCANSYFFAQGNDLGLLGGFFEASVFSFINVGLAFLVSHFYRKTYHIDKTNNTKGWLGVFGFSILIIFIACVAALCRYQAAQSQGIEFTSLPWQDFTKAVLSKEGILLITLALILATIAVIDWFTMDDAYPGYGDQQRKVEEVEAWVNDKRTETINSLHLNFVNRMRDVEIPILEKKLDLLVTRAQNIIKITHNYDQAVVKQLEATYHSLLKEYRDENAFVRHDDKSQVGSAPPDYFNSYPKLNIGSINFEKITNTARTWLRTFSDAKSYFEIKKHSAMTEQYSLKLKKIVVDNFENCIKVLEANAKKQNAENEAA
jgi:hypothetical protein